MPCHLSEQAVCRDVLLRRYTQAGEFCVDHVLGRVASALSALEAPDQRTRWHDRFLWALRRGLVPAGRILAGAGAVPHAMLINCFVLPIKEPSGLGATMADALTTLRMGGGVGYDFSGLAPSASLLNAMRELDDACGTLSRGWVRPGAQMGVLRCDHPDILSFVHAKDAAELPTFNLSVAVSDAFMRAVEADACIELLHASEPRGGRQDFPSESGLWADRIVRARVLWQAIMESSYDHGEPGLLFIDRINEDNNLSFCEQISATNPCAEQPLPPYGACCLASLDLTRLVLDPFKPDARFNQSGMAELVKVAVRLLDNVLDLTDWPLNAQMAEARLKRRIGLGITGLGDALVMLGLRYDTAQARQEVARWMRTMRDTAYTASSNLAAERGAFPLFQADEFLRAPHFSSRLPNDIQDAVRHHGLRHSHLLAVAPAGSISLAMCDNVSSGIEPVFAWQMQRNVRGDDGSTHLLTVEDHAWRLYRRVKGIEAALPPAFVTAHEVAPADHVAMVGAIAPFVDGGISKTVNVPEDLPLSEFEKIHMQAWKSGLKSLTAYRTNSTLPPTLRALPNCHQKLSC